MIHRRSFLAGVGAAPFATLGLSGATGPASDDGKETVRYWDSIDREAKMLQMADDVIEGTDPEEVVLTSPDLADDPRAYESVAPAPTGAAFVRALTEEVPALSPADLSVRAYAPSECTHPWTLRSLVVDSVAIPIPAGDTDRVLAATTDWEDRVRSRALRRRPEGPGEAAELGHDRGISRLQSFTDSCAYRLQRLRLLGDRLLVTWSEGRHVKGWSGRSLAEVSQFERSALLRRVQQFLDEGGSIPASMPKPTRPSWGR